MDSHAANKELANKVHELDILVDELSSLQPKAAVYAKRVPSSNVLFLSNKSTLIASTRAELSATKGRLAAIPGASSSSS